MDAKERIKAAAEERKKQMNKTRDDGNLKTDNTKKRTQNISIPTKSNNTKRNNRTNYVPSGPSTYNKKMRNDGVPYEGELLEMCVSCGCNIF